MLPMPQRSGRAGWRASSVPVSRLMVADPPSLGRTLPMATMRSAINPAGRCRLVSDRRRPRHRDLGPAAAPPRIRCKCRRASARADGGREPLAHRRIGTYGIAAPSVADAARGLAPQSLVWAILRLHGWQCHQLNTRRHAIGEW
jgi:hypothetical protein